MEKKTLDNAIVSTAQGASVNISEVPEPSTAALLVGISVIALGVRRLRKKE
jgi:hypothetical protein